MCSREAAVRRCLDERVGYNCFATTARTASDIFSIRTFRPPLTGAPDVNLPRSKHLSPPTTVLDTLHKSSQLKRLSGAPRPIPQPAQQHRPSPLPTQTKQTSLPPTLPHRNQQHCHAQHWQSPPVLTTPSRRILASPHTLANSLTPFVSRPRTPIQNPRPHTSMMMYTHNRTLFGV